MEVNIISTLFSNTVHEKYQLSRKIKVMKRHKTLKLNLVPFRALRFCLKLNPITFEIYSNCTPLLIKGKCSNTNCQIQIKWKEKGNTALHLIGN